MLAVGLVELAIVAGGHLLLVAAAVVRAADDLPEQVPALLDVVLDAAVGVAVFS